MSSSLTQEARKNLMLVEDDVELAGLIRDFLMKYEFNVSIVTDGLEAVDKIIKQQPDLVILDIMLPGQSGMEVCRQVRSYYKGAILMQTALDDDIDQMMGLELGADDYVIKQVQPRLLLSRIRALLRRIEPNNQKGRELSSVVSDANSLQIGPLKINIAARLVHVNAREVDLTTAEFELLHLLATKPGEVISRDSIVQQLRGYEYDGLDRSIDRRISRLRRKLQCGGQQPEFIKTIRGQGYQLCLHTDSVNK
ncbi:winged helix-turn-helix domain-containing protein [Pseudoalteromonas sp. Of7M-16]|uniref:winged helix-turn-helix domain-containing protein n=1 Tax=Pseudoalteromonas sp. Of7M-16 TaxID=2917756 RepID=UPI001EF5BB32|nr:winged helix-turn-helix domain-containing protein [Pseudoalteromonas sp. Of7M-16]MCG7551737.1 winged helix-turn-helix domain-containing protein [Pseudoalteromonas sp. Of7M-16]